MRITNPGVTDNSITTAKIQDGAVTYAKTSGWGINRLARFFKFSQTVTLPATTLWTVTGQDAYYAWLYLYLNNPAGANSAIIHAQFDWTGDGSAWSRVLGDLSAGGGTAETQHTWQLMLADAAADINLTVTVNTAGNSGWYWDCWCYVYEG